MGNFAIKEISSSSSFLSSDLQRKQLILVISSLDCSCSLGWNYRLGWNCRGTISAV